MAQRRSAEEVRHLVERYRASGMTQIAYCRQAGIAHSTLSRYLQRHRVGDQHLIRVHLEPAVEADRGFALVLANGRRIESGWKFAEADLSRLIRVAEAV